jgi:hypothetical protein
MKKYLADATNKVLRGPVDFEKDKDYTEFAGYLNSLPTIPAKFLSEGMNGQVLIEGVDFEIKYQELFVGNYITPTAWLDSNERSYKHLHESRRRIIAVPLQANPEKQERVFTLDEMIECFQDSFLMSSNNSDAGIKDYFKEKFNIDL